MPDPNKNDVAFTDGCYKQRREEWGALAAFERRVVGDDSTIQRKQGPETGEWIDVTSENVHFSDEDVMPA